MGCVSQRRDSADASDTDSVEHLPSKTHVRLGVVAVRRTYNFIRGKGKSWATTLATTIGERVGWIVMLVAAGGTESGALLHRARRTEWPRVEPRHTCCLAFLGSVFRVADAARFCNSQASRENRWKTTVLVVMVGAVRGIVIPLLDIASRLFDQT